jgi:hypothetical protein
MPLSARLVVSPFVGGLVSQPDFANHLREPVQRGLVSCHSASGIAGNSSMTPPSPPGTAA